MKTVAIVSLKGGVGRTTVAANLGAALSPHQSVLLVDLDRRNQLGCHFGLAREAAGLAQVLTRAGGWARARWEVSDRLACVPFGPATPPLDLEAQLARRPQLLDDGFADPALSDHALVLLDTGVGLLDQALPRCDLLLAVLRADAASFATLPSLEALLAQHSGVAAHVLLNGVDGSRLARDVRTVMSARLPGLVLPFVIHADQAVPEALALQRPVLESAPSSLAADDFRRAAEWLRDALQAAQPAQPRALSPSPVGAPPATGTSR
jgi:cellulose synthase operon protein YhjQ